MPMESLLSEKAKATLANKFGITANSFDHNVMSVLALACDEGDVTNERLRYVLNMHKSAISELLKLMVKNDLLEAYGYGRGMRYRLPAKSTNMFGLDLSISGDNTICQVTSSPNNSTNSASSDANSASPQKKRMPREELKSLIISICADWVSIEEIVERTGKSYSYIRNSLMPILLAEKSIVMMYPGAPRNPNQKYRVKE